MLDFMKVEIKTNATTAKFLRLQEKKNLDAGRLYREVMGREEEGIADIKEKMDSFYNIYQNLRSKRVNELRKIQRVMFLAYGFLNGWDYKDLEDNSHTVPDFNVVEKYIFYWLPVDTFDPREVKQEFEMWIQQAMDHVNSNVK